MNNFLYGNSDPSELRNDLRGEPVPGQTTTGASAVHSHMTNTRMTDPEVLELRFPVRVEEFSIRRGLGWGEGTYCRCGDGAVRKLRFLGAHDGNAALFQSAHRPPMGLQGGGPGQIVEKTDWSRQ